MKSRQQSFVFSDEKSAQNKFSKTLFRQIGYDLQEINKVIDDLSQARHDNAKSAEIIKNKAIYDLLLKAIFYKKDILLKVNDFILENCEEDNSINYEQVALEVLQSLNVNGNK